MADSATLSIDLGKLKANTASIAPARLNHVVSGYMLGNAPKVESYAKVHAPWTDRTGNARQGLAARYSSPSLGVHRITLSHSVPYGIWLEVRWAGRFAVIKPTIEAEGHRIMKGLNGLFSKLSGLAGL